MSITDVIIIFLFITAMVRGVERGLVRQICSTAGLVLGFLIGVLVQGQIIGLATTDSSKAVLSLIIILSVIIIGTTAAEYLGNNLKARIERVSIRAVDATDRASGALVGGLTLLILCWLASSVIAGMPLPGLQRELKSSVIISQLNKTLPVAPDIVSRLGNFIDPNGTPEVFTGLEPAIDTETPVPSIGELDAAVKQTRPSVVKVEGEGCGGISAGSGFVADSNLIITNAHVVAGVSKPEVIDGNGRHQSQVIWFDPDLDLAVLRTNNLAGQPLPISTTVANNNSPAVALGYPGGGSFTAEPATILDAFTAEGRNIYNQGQTERRVYSLKANIQPGNSGGPLVDRDGNVIGLVFAESTTYDEVGYALLMDAIQSELNQAKDQNRTTGTGSCTH